MTRDFVLSIIDIIQVLFPITSPPSHSPPSTPPPSDDIYHDMPALVSASDSDSDIVSLSDFDEDEFQFFILGPHYLLMDNLPIFLH